MDTNQGIRHKEHIQDAISWYNKFLGFRVEGGHGVKFIFNNINSSQNPNEEYSFTLRHADDNYTLLDYDPYLGDMKEFIQELNQTNGLFKFVRIMREKFQATTLKVIAVEQRADKPILPSTSDGADEVINFGNCSMKMGRPTGTPKSDAWDPRFLSTINTFTVTNVLDEVRLFLFMVAKIPFKIQKSVGLEEEIIGDSM
ncbi:hypothetical protein GIB67_038777, partial [Kingdonia uniflora]